MGIRCDVCSFDANGPVAAPSGADFVPNGIPDAAEFGLFEAFLKTLNTAKVTRTGVDPENARTAWDYDFHCAERDLGDRGDVPGAAETLAAYEAVGGPGGRRFISHLLKERYSLEVSEGEYRTVLDLEGDDYLGDQELSNLEQWEMVSRGKPVTKELIAEYVRAAMHGK